MSNVEFRMYETLRRHWTDEEATEFVQSLDERVATKIEIMTQDLATKKDIGLLKSDIELLQSDIGLLKFDFGLLKSDVALLKSDVGVLKSDVALLKSDVGVLKSDVGVLKSDVGVLKSDVELIKSDIKLLDVKIDTVKSDLKVAFAEFRAEITKSIHSVTLLQLVAIVGALVSIVIAMKI